MTSVLRTAGITESFKLQQIQQDRITGICFLLFLGHSGKELTQDITENKCKNQVRNHDWSIGQLQLAISGGKFSTGLLRERGQRRNRFMSHLFRKEEKCGKKLNSP